MNETPPADFNVYETQRNSNEKKYLKGERKSDCSTPTIKSKEPVPQCEISLKNPEELRPKQTQSDHETKPNEIDHESVESTPTVPTRQNIGKLDPTPQAVEKLESPP